MDTPQLSPVSRLLPRIVVVTCAHGRVGKDRSNATIASCADGAACEIARTRANAGTATDGRTSTSTSTHTQTWLRKREQGHSTPTRRKVYLQRDRAARQRRVRQRVVNLALQQRAAARVPAAARPLGQHGRPTGRPDDAAGGRPSWKRLFMHAGTYRHTTAHSHKLYTKHTRDCRDSLPGLISNWRRCVHTHASLAATNQ